MIIPASASKAAPVIAPPLAIVLAGFGLDAHFFVKSIAVIFGLVGGAIWRAGMLKKQRRPWSEIRDDLYVSALIGIANGIVALFISEKLGTGILLAMFTGAIVGATGVRALPAIRGAVIDLIRQNLNAPPARTEFPDPEIDDFNKRTGGVDDPESSI